VGGWVFKRAGPQDGSGLRVLLRRERDAVRYSHGATETVAKDFWRNEAYSNLQKAAHKLHRLTTEYGLTRSVQKTNSMAI
jgi:hypothetical protein